MATRKLEKLGPGRVNTVALKPFYGTGGGKNSLWNYMNLPGGFIDVCLCNLLFRIYLAEIRTLERFGPGRGHTVSLDVIHLQLAFLDVAATCCLGYFFGRLGR